MKKKIPRLFTRESLFVIISLVALIGLTAYGIIYSRTMINPAAYQSLLTVIAEGESRGNYNAYFGSVANNTTDFTAMTVDEVLEWQTDYVAQGSPSNAVGRYQIIRPTLLGLVDELNLSGSEIFNEALQDKMAIALLERRGLIEFVRGDLSLEDFGHNLSKEWAALPRITGNNPEASYYAGDGLNASLISTGAVIEALRTFKTIARN